MKKIYCLGYGPTANIGDEIQTLAAKQALAKLGFEFGGLVDRDTPVSEEKINLLINGFIHHRSLDKLINTPSINPIFTNLHLATVNWDKIGATMERLKEFAPIGCRDRWTTKVLQSYGVDAFFNYCMTLTFDRRQQEPADGKIIFVDQLFMKRKHKISEQDRVNALKETHKAAPDATHEYKFAKAQELLDRYRDEAKLIITSRLHCALPCVAMGIPVIIYYLWNEPRLDLVKEFLPLHIYRTCSAQRPLNYFYNRKIFPLKQAQEMIIWLQNRITHSQVDWHPQPQDIENLKQQILQKVEEQINRHAV